MSKFVISALLLAALGGCGQKGPLYEEKTPVKNQPEQANITDKKEST